MSAGSPVRRVETRLHLAQERPPGHDLAREDARDVAPVGRERTVVGGPFDVGERAALEVPWQVDPEHQVQAIHSERAQRTAHECREEPDRQSVVRPGPGVPDDQGADQLRPASGQAQADGPAPCIPEDDQVGQPEPLDKRLDDPRLGRGSEVEPRRLARKAEARVVGRHAAERVAQPQDHVAPPERPARVAVEQQERWARALIDIVHEVAVDVGPAILEGVQVGRDPARPGPRQVGHDGDVPGSGCHLSKCRACAAVYAPSV